MPRVDYPAHAFLPTLLSKEEIQQPDEVVAAFFNTFFIPEVRNELKEIFHLLVTGGFPHTPSRGERGDLAYFYGRLEKLIEAVHVIHEQNKRGL